MAADPGSAPAQRRAGNPVAVPVQALHAALLQVKHRFLTGRHFAAGLFAPAGQSVGCGGHWRGSGLAQLAGVLADKGIIPALDRRNALMAGLLPGVGRILLGPGREKLPVLIREVKAIGLRHRDLEAPIVSVSLGLPAVFLFGGLKRKDPMRRIPLEHGDVLVWGGPDRLRYHGVLPLKAGHHAELGRQRLNLTFRQAA